MERWMTDDRLKLLQEIIDSLPSVCEKDERRKNALTKGDVTIIYQIARIAMEPHECPFDDDDIAVLHGVARNITKTQKISFVVLVTALVSGAISGIGYMALNLLRDFINSGGVLPK